MTLYNSFLLKRGVGLFLRVGLFSGDYSTTIMYVNSSPSFLGHVSLLHWLLSHGATADTDDLGRGTSLHDIAEHGQVTAGGQIHFIYSVSSSHAPCSLAAQALKVKVPTGIDHIIQDLDGLTPVDLAEECASAEFLRSYKPPQLADLHIHYGVSLPVKGLAN